MKNLLLLWFVTLSISGASQEFDSDLWKKDTVGTYGYRVRMLNLLPEFQGFKEDSLYRLLGLPDFYMLGPSDNDKVLSSLELICLDGKLIFYLYENYLYKDPINNYMYERPIELNIYSSSALILCIVDERVRFVGYWKH